MLFPLTSQETEGQAASGTLPGPQIPKAMSISPKVVPCLCMAVGVQACKGWGSGTNIPIPALGQVLSVLEETRPPVGFAASLTDRPG